MKPRPLQNQKLLRTLGLIFALLLVCGLLSIFRPMLSSGDFARYLTRQSMLKEFESNRKDQLSKLEAAKRTWDNQAFQNYNLAIEVSTRNLNYDALKGPVSYTCHLEIEVRQKAYATMTQNTCGENAYVLPTNGYYPEQPVFDLIGPVKTPSTIETMFKLIEYEINTRRYERTNNGFECDGYYSYSIEYDSIHGSPQQLMVAYHRPKALGPYFCTMVASLGLMIYPEYNLSITPLP